jgi:hypothetical protein
MTWPVATSFLMNSFVSLSLSYHSTGGFAEDFFGGKGQPSYPNNE